MIRICEIFQSLQGEGLLTGAPSVFVRTSGCNLACRFCDTRYASTEPEGEFYTVFGILSEIDRRQLNADHVVITGGEPLIQPDVADLCVQLKNRGLHITIETAGTVYRDLPCDLMSISPKMKNSVPEGPRGPLHEKTRFQPDVLKKLIDQYPYQLKFVVKAPEDLPEIDQFCRQFDNLDRDRVLYMPQGQTLEELKAVEAWLIPWAYAAKVRFCPRKHIEWFGPGRGV